MGFERMCEALAVIRREIAVLRSEPLDGASTAELLAFAADWESLVRSSATVEHRVVAELGRAPAEELGVSSVGKALQTLLKISPTDANRRVGEAADLAPRTAMTGEVLAPMLANTAAAVADGRIGAEQLRLIRKFFNKQIPPSVSFDVHEQAEKHLADVASTLNPAGLEKALEHMVTLLEEHFEFREHERRRKTGVWFGPQDRDGISEIHGAVDAPTRGWIEAGLASYGAPGQNMPDAEPAAPQADPAPQPEPAAPDPSPSEELALRDTRTRAQRNHDGLGAMCRDLLASGKVGSHNGFPATMVITATLQDLQEAAGFGVTAGGTLVPMADVIRLAAQAHHYLAVFDKHTNEPLYLGRAKRCASTAQRLMLFSLERGCTRPGCTAPAYETQVHHAVADWADGGSTDITALTLACPDDNRSVKRGGYRTRKRRDGRTEWLPPPQLDTGQARVNNYHHPERYLIPDDGAGDNADDDDGGEKPDPTDTDRDAG